MFCETTIIQSLLIILNVVNSFIKIEIRNKIYDKIIKNFNENWSILCNCIVHTKNSPNWSQMTLMTFLSGHLLFINEISAAKGSIISTYRGFSTFVEFWMSSVSISSASVTASAYNATL